MTKSSIVHVKRYYVYLGAPIAIAFLFCSILLLFFGHTSNIDNTILNILGFSLTGIAIISAILICCTKEETYFTFRVAQWLQDLILIIGAVIRAVVIFVITATVIFIPQLV
jgi:hypothetical protein